MPKKRITQREIGFTQGVAYAAALLARYDLDAETLIKECGFAKDIRKYGEECDVEGLDKILKKLGV